MTGATRQNIFKLRRSNVSGKIPTTSQLLVGELAVNTQEGFLFTAISDSGGTTTTGVRQIGWDRLSTLSGGTVNGPVIFNSGVTATTFQTTSIKINGPTIAGYVLTTDANGNGTWQASTGNSGTTVDTFVTGFTYSNNIFTISQNQGRPNLSVTTPNFITGFTDNFVTGGTLNRSTDTLTLFRQNGDVNITGITDTFLTGGTFNSTTGILTLSQNEGTPNITITGITDTFVTGLTVSNSVLTLSQNNGRSGLTATIGLTTKVGFLSGGTFAGNPKTANVTFTTNFSNSNYAILLTGGANRTYTYENQSVSGFTINANANPAFTSNVYWQAISYGETL